MAKNKKLKLIIDFLKEKKTDSLKVLDISKISILADYFIIVTVSTERSVDSLDTNICDILAENGYDVKRKEGVHSKWLLIDLEDIVIHIFDSEYSGFYNLDKLWADAKEVDINKI